MYSQYIFVKYFNHERDCPIWYVNECHCCSLHFFILFPQLIDLSSLQIIQLIFLESTYIHINVGCFPFFNLFILFIFYLFIFGWVGSSLLPVGFLQLRQAGATLCCSARASRCGGFACCGARALGVWASVVVAHGLRCSVACGIFPDQGSNPCPLHWQENS